jgi:hypothetical protein
MSGFGCVNRPCESRIASQDPVSGQLPASFLPTIHQPSKSVQAVGGTEDNFALLTGRLLEPHN